jgi:hypothetical protein
MALILLSALGAAIVVAGWLVYKLKQIEKRNDG